MKIDWILVGWIIDMILNGVVWLIIVALALPLIDKTDKWTRKAVKLMGSADDFIRKVLEDLFELIEKFIFVRLNIARPTIWYAS